MMRFVPLGDLVHSAQVERAGTRKFTVLSMTRAAGLVPQESVFNKVVASRDLGNYKIVRPNQLVVGIHIDEGALGFSGTDQVGIVSPAYALWDLSDATKVHIPYLDRFIRSSQAVGYFVSKYRETAERRGKLTREQFLALNVPLPPLAEQKRITAILDAADGMRVKRRESLAQLDTLLQSTFLDMFGDPVTNPKGWKVVDFKEVGTSRLGKMLDKGKEAGNCQFPYLANFNVQWGRFVLDDLRCMDFTEKDRQEFELKDSDLLVCEGGEVGRTAIWRGEMKDVYFQKALHRIRLNPSKSVPEYVQQYMWFMAKNGGFRDFTNSATIAHLTGVKLRTLPLPLPPLTLQRRFATIAESVEKQKARLREHLAELDTLFASLQQRAFNGEL